MLNVQSSMDINDITIIVKAFLRPTAVDRLVLSIRRFYPHIQIFIADDGDEPANKHGINRMFILPFDSGVSYGRNFLLQQVETRYLMVVDDDTVFTENSHLEYPLFILQNTTFDLVGGVCLPKSFYGIQTFAEGKLIRDIHLCREISEGFPVYEFVPNFFLAKTDKVRAVGWDPELKIQEHMDFFHRAKGVIKTTLLPYFSCINTRERTRRYEEYRSRADYFQTLQCKKLGVDSIVSRKNEPNFIANELSPWALEPPVPAF